MRNRSPFDPTAYDKVKGSPTESARSRSAYGASPPTFSDRPCLSTPREPKPGEPDDPTDQPSNSSSNTALDPPYDNLDGYDDNDNLDDTQQQDQQDDTQKEEDKDKGKDKDKENPYWRKW